MPVACTVSYRKKLIKLFVYSRGLESMKTTFESLNGVSYRTGIILTDGKEEEAPVDTALVSFFLFNTCSF